MEALTIHNRNCLCGLVSLFCTLFQKKEYRPAKKMQNRRNFSCKKYGTAEAEKLAAITANQFLDQLNDTERPRNIIT